ncbi:hypothetical protein SAMN02799622_01842 [Methylobacterium sp. UNC378MF]|uniref:hypothetical protein n=1 Tax=Methylobacterium sp. UNC378MF TaxID=1502748 RepID=UPI00088657B4|nr:hypothetical protein [Methylobacterium sp. UNC378MF]SDA17568.1 hypothetical protein SAMN02799622_01842 [Methylobacterium sp. UNC378MF]
MAEHPLDYECAVHGQAWREVMRREQEHRARARAIVECDYVRPSWRLFADVWLDAEADKAARPAIGKPLSIRARRRNRGRIRAERARLGRDMPMSIQWAWPHEGGFHG